MSRPVAHFSRRYHFSASHRLHVDALSEEENRATFGKCNNPFGHGHNYVVEVTVSGPVDPVTGMVVNLADLDSFARREVLDLFDYANLNTLEAFRDRVTTTENVAIAIWRRLEGKIEPAKLYRVRVYEMPDLFADFYGEGA